MEQGIMLKTRDSINTFALLSLKGRLKMELIGMKCRGRSAYSVIKERYKLKGTRESVLKQLEDKLTRMKEIMTNIEVHHQLTVDQSELTCPIFQECLPSFILEAFSNAKA